MNQSKYSVVGSVSGDMVITEENKIDKTSSISSHELSGNRRTSLMSSSLLLQQRSTCLVRLTWMVFETKGKWPYRCCLVRCSFIFLLTLNRACGVMVIVVGNGHSDTSSNTGRH